MAIRLLIVDDSALVREVLKDIFEETGVEVVGEAVNGKEAIEKTKELKPNIITMDVMMPIMDGLTAVEQIMAYSPTPILVLAASTNRRDVNIAFEAIQLGALDVMEKPMIMTRDSFSAMKEDIVRKVRLLSNIKVISHIRGRHSRAPVLVDEKKPAPERRRPKPSESSVAVGDESDLVVAIGASTGGPKAVLNILSSIPSNFPVPIMLTQHIGQNFTEGFVEWLARSAAINVKEAIDGERLKPGTVFVAPGDSHLCLYGNRLVLDNSPPVNSCRPSVDVMFNSVASSMKEKAIGVLLTGMGRDGAVGLKAIKDGNGRTLVQDKESSVIFGMPKAAIDLGAAENIKPLKEIPDEIFKLVQELSSPKKRRLGS